MEEGVDATSETRKDGALQHRKLQLEIESADLEIKERQASLRASTLKWRLITLFTPALLPLLVSGISLWQSY